MKIIAIITALMVGEYSLVSNASGDMPLGKIYAIELVGSEIILSDPSPDFLPPIPLQKPPFPSP